MTGCSVLALIMSFLLGFLLTMLPISPFLNDFYPIWLIPILIYWMMATPQLIGLFTAWCCGLLLDALFNSLFGAHALALLICAACFGKLAQRFRLFSGLQQMLIILLLSTLYLTLLNVIRWFSHQPIAFAYAPALTTALIWPIVAFFLRNDAHPVYPR